MYLVDANIFLEVQLDQERAGECMEFLEKVKDGLIEAVISDFHIDTIIVVMESNGLAWKDIKKFLISLAKYSGLKVYYTSLKDRIIATNHMREFKLTFDDSIGLQSMIANRILQIVSFDSDFDGIPHIKRLEPRELL